MPLSTAPTLTVQLFPPLVMGNSGNDAIELHCIAFVTENIISASYQFTWSKDGVAMGQLNIKNVVCNLNTVYDWIWTFFIYTDYQCQHIIHTAHQCY